VLCRTAPHRRFKASNKNKQQHMARSHCAAKNKRPHGLRVVRKLEREHRLARKTKTASSTAAPAPDARTAALHKLQQSGLGTEDLKLLRMEALTGKQVGALTLPAYNALRIPYFDLNGKPTAFYRLRYLEDTRAADPFMSATTAQPLRYIQPPDTLNEVYLSPAVNWKQVADNPEVSVVITEGELKAACACKLRIPTMGLGGVWCFKSVKRKLPLLPIFAQIKWKGRTVYVCYDSDAATNADVVVALYALCKELLALGAVPKVVTLPALPKLGKTGLDDYLVDKGAKAFTRLLEQANPFATSAALYELNGEVAYVRDPGLVVVMADGLKMTPGAFKEHAFANRHYYEEKITEQGVKMVKKPVAPAWLQWEQRASLSKLTYAPGEGRITADRAYNSWPGWGCAPKRGDVTPWRGLLDHLFGRGWERQWLERWLAYPLQHPGAKLFTAAVVWGVMTGTGKSLIGYSMERIYGKNFIEIGDEELGDARREWAQNKQFVMGDDVTSGENKRHMADRLKKMITQQSIRIDPKYIPSFTLPDCINYYFNSNHCDAFFIEDADRRYFVWEVTVNPLPHSFYRDYEKWYKSADGAAALFHHLLTLDLGDFDPAAPAPMTQAKQTMIEDGLSDMGTWVRKLRNDPEAVLKMGSMTLDGDLWSSEELLKIYDPEQRSKVSGNMIARELKRAGLRHVARGMSVRTSNGQRRLYAVRNIPKWQQAGQAAAAKHYEETRGEGASTPHREPGSKIK
jgi:hypothetical protein